MKKVLLSAAGTLAIATPAIAAVSCGSSGNYDLKVGIRPEEANMWKPVISQFEKSTGKKVKLAFVNNQQQDYATWNGSSNMPNVALADSGTAQAGHEKKWFQDINLQDILGTNKYMIESTGEFKEVEKKFDTATYEKQLMSSNIIDASSNLYSASALVFGPKLTYTWKALPDGKGGKVDLFNDDIPLKWYVPNKAGDGMESVTFSDASSPLKSLDDDHHTLKANQKDIQEFLSRAISSTDLVFNQSTYNFASLSDADPKKRVIATGMPGYKQRIASVGKVLYDIYQNSDASAGMKAKLKMGAFSDPAIPYSTIALGSAQYQNTQEKVSRIGSLIGNDGKLDESKVFSGIDGIADDNFKIRVGRLTTNQKKTMTELEVINYLSVFGYNRKGFAGPSGFFENHDDAQVGFGNGQVVFLPNGALWQKGSIYAKMANTLGLNNDDAGQKKINDDYLTAFAQPVQETGVDGYAISHSTTGDKLKLAKQFIRFLYQKKVSAILNGTKTLPIAIDANDLLPASTDAAVKYAIDNAGVKWFNGGKTYISDLSWSMAKSSYNSKSKVKATKAIYDIYNDFYMQGDEFNNKDGYTPAATMTSIDAYNNKFQDQIEQ